MAYNLYFNAAATDPKGALCKSITNLTPANPPAWVVGEARAVNIYIADGNGDFDPISGDATAEIMLGLGVLGSVPTGGTFTITSGANTTSALAFDASAADIETALNDLASITSEGGVSVSGAFPVFAVDWNTTGSKALMAGDGTDLTPDSDAAISQVRAGDGSTKERQLIQLRQQPAALQTAFSTIDDGWSGTLNLNTRGIVDLVGTLAAVSDAYLELRVTDASGNVRVYGQVGNVIRNNVIDPLSLIPVPLPDYLTADGCRAQFVQNRSTITALTGGTSGCLDAILTANDAAQTGWLVAVTIDDEMAVYQLQSGGDAESVPDVIRPDDFNGSTNLRIWRLVSSSSNGGDGTLRFWTESTEVVGTTQASKWTPNVTGLDPVPADAVPDVTSADPVVFGSYPAGTYRVNYLGGGMRYGPGLTQFKINASGSYGFRVVHSGGTEIEGPATSYTGYNTVAELEAANAGAFVEFTHTGGDISVYLLDSPYDDNTAGTPSPTFELVGANADVHALIQPKGTGSVVLADDTGAAPEPSTDSELTARFAGGYRFTGGSAAFDGTVSGDDPEAAQDFVTKAYGDSNYGGGGLTNWTESAGAYGGKDFSKFTPVSGGSNADAVIQPKGSGAVLGQQPDGTAAGGNVRGALAVDLQLSRAAAAQVASGARSALVGGLGNLASADDSSVLAGEANEAEGPRSAVVGGYSSKAAGENSVILGGQDNETYSSALNSAILSGNYNAVGTNGAESVVIGGNHSSASYAQSIAWGQNAAAVNAGALVFSSLNSGGATSDADDQATMNFDGGYRLLGGGVALEGSTAAGSNSLASGNTSSASGYASAAIGGLNTTASTDNAFAAGGAASTASGTGSIALGGGTASDVASFVICAPTGGGGNNGVASAENSGAIGYGALADVNSQIAHGSGHWSAGKSQASQFILAGTTTNNTATELLTQDGSQMLLRRASNWTVWAFQVRFAATRTDSSGEADGWTFDGVCYCDSSGAASMDIVGTPIKTSLTSGATSWDVDVVADTTTGALKITVTGETGKTIRWVAVVNTTEVGKG